LTGNNSLLDEFLLYHYDHGFSAASHGDSGGPDLIFVDGHWQIIGVTSHQWGDTYGAWDWSLRVTKYADWIDYVMANSALPPASPPVRGPL
jgi:hypothetical protein